MQGRRLPDRAFSRRLSHGDELGIQPGAYGRVLRDGDWVWMCCTPNGLIGDLTNHEVVEHADGTITVSPSIESQGGKGVLVAGDDVAQFEECGLMGYWHGFLECGVWRSC